ncbi:MAG: DsbA family protein [Deltaproteobacteria bacterium]|nr:DsbA family protein [Deltaproteobacteria bacterium]
MRLRGLTLAIVGGAVLAVASSGYAKSKGEPAKLEMFVMSQCPYGVQVENAVVPVKQQLGDMLDLSIRYIGDGDKDNLKSLHGPAEVKGDIVQLCVNKLAAAKSLDFIACQNKNSRAVDTNWADCAKELGIDDKKLTACAEGDEGKAMLVASFQEAKTRGANGSPTMFLNGKPYNGGRKSRDFLRAACDAMPGEKAEACKNLPVPPAVAGVILSDKRCAKCDTSRIEPRLKQDLAGLQVKYVDYMSDEGKKLYNDLRKAQPDFKFLPAVLLDKAVEKDEEGYGALKNFMRPIGDWQEVKFGGQFDPTAEICDNKVDDDGNGKTDCDDESCRQSMSCRQARPKTLEMFVMSQCPYGAKAMIAANDLAQHFGGEGKKLLAQDFSIAQALGIGASPTFIANGQRQFNAVDVANLQKQYCQDNADLDACKTAAKPSDPAAAAAQVPAGACGPK